jgi:acyl carrier protein
MTKNEIFDKMKEIIIDTFEIDSARIKPESLLLNDLDLDSIDAVDLIVKLQQFTNRKIDPETFKQVRTIQDVVDAIYSMMEDGGAN